MSIADDAVLALLANYEAVEAERNKYCKELQHTKALFDVCSREEFSHRQQRDAALAQVATLRGALEVADGSHKHADRCSLATSNLANDTRCPECNSNLEAGRLVAVAIHSTVAASAEHERALLAKERGMVACLHSALGELAKWVKSGVLDPVGLAAPHQWDLANKVLADGAAMAAAHDEAIRAKVLEEVKTLVATQPNAPDTKVGRRQQWVRDQIIEKLKALEKPL